MRLMINRGVVYIYTEDEGIGLDLVFVLDDRNHRNRTVHPQWLFPRTSYIRMGGHLPIELPKNWIAV